MGVWRLCENGVSDQWECGGYVEKRDDMICTVRTLGDVFLIFISSYVDWNCSIY